ncbi:unnamed protein product [Amoebophrya sp. A120]|nr:unnamed protein product [Amoebophrya sp. A120]|eukprot:GSA120T00019012001.1
MLVCLWVTGFMLISVLIRYAPKCCTCCDCLKKRWFWLHFGTQFFFYVRELLILSLFVGWTRLMIAVHIAMTFVMLVTFVELWQLSHLRKYAPKAIDQIMDMVLLPANYGLLMAHTVRILGQQLEGGQHNVEREFLSRFFGESYDTTGGQHLGGSGSTGSTTSPLQSTTMFAAQDSSSFYNTHPASSASSYFISLDDPFAGERDAARLAVADTTIQTADIWEAWALWSVLTMFTGIVDNLSKNPNPSRVTRISPRGMLSSRHSSPLEEPLLAGSTGTAMIGATGGAAGASAAALRPRPGAATSPNSPSGREQFTITNRDDFYVSGGRTTTTLGAAGTMASSPGAGLSLQDRAVTSFQRFCFAVLQLYVLASMLSNILQVIVKGLLGIHFPTLCPYLLQSCEYTCVTWWDTYVGPYQALILSLFCWAAIYAVFVFEGAFHGELSLVDPFWKFFGVKGVVSVTWTQWLIVRYVICGYYLQWEAYYLYAFLTVLEVPILAIVHAFFAYPVHNVYLSVSPEAATQWLTEQSKGAGGGAPLQPPPGTTSGNTKLAMTASSSATTSSFYRVPPALTRNDSKSTNNSKPGTTVSSPAEELFVPQNPPRYPPQGLDDFVVGTTLNFQENPNEQHLVPLRQYVYATVMSRSPEDIRAAPNKRIVFATDTWIRYLIESSSAAAADSKSGSRVKLARSRTSSRPRRWREAATTAAAASSRTAASMREQHGGATSSTRTLEQTGRGRFSSAPADGFSFMAGEHESKKQVGTSNSASNTASSSSSYFDLATAAAHGGRDDAAFTGVPPGGGPTPAGAESGRMTRRRDQKVTVRSVERDQSRSEDSGNDDGAEKPRMLTTERAGSSNVLGIVLSSASSSDGADDEGAHGSDEPGDISSAGAAPRPLFLRISDRLCACFRGGCFGKDSSSSSSAPASAFSEPKSDMVILDQNRDGTRNGNGDEVHPEDLEDSGTSSSSRLGRVLSWFAAPFVSCFSCCRSKQSSTSSSCLPWLSASDAAGRRTSIAPQTSDTATTSTTTTCCSRILTARRVRNCRKFLKRSVISVVVSFVLVLFMLYTLQPDNREDVGNAYWYNVECKGAFPAVPHTSVIDAQENGICSKTQLACNIGYRGQPTVTCNPSLVYDVAGTCAVVGCGAPPRIPNANPIYKVDPGDHTRRGTMHLDNGYHSLNDKFVWTAGEVVHYTCNPGYTGSVQARCSVSGAFTIEGGCDLVGCGVHPPQLQHARAIVKTNDQHPMNYAGGVTSASAAAPAAANEKSQSDDLAQEKQHAQAMQQEQRQDTKGNHLPASEAVPTSGLPEHPINRTAGAAAQLQSTSIILTERIPHAFSETSAIEEQATSAPSADKNASRADHDHHLVLKSSYAGERIAFVCELGYTGSPVAECQNDGNWIATDTCRFFTTTLGCQCEPQWVNCDDWLLGANCFLNYGCKHAGRSYQWCAVDPISCPESSALSLLGFHWYPRWDYCVDANESAEEHHRVAVPSRGFDPLAWVDEAFAFEGAAAFLPMLFLVALAFLLLGAACGSSRGESVGDGVTTIGGSEYGGSPGAPPSGARGQGGSYAEASVDRSDSSPGSRLPIWSRLFSPWSMKSSEAREAQSPLSVLDEVAADRQGLLSEPRVGLQDSSVDLEKNLLEVEQQERGEQRSGSVREDEALVVPLLGARLSLEDRDTTKEKQTGREGTAGTEEAVAGPEHTDNAGEDAGTNSHYVPPPPFPQSVSVHFEVEQTPEEPVATALHLGAAGEHFHEQEHVHLQLGTVDGVLGGEQSSLGAPAVEQNSLILDSSTTPPAAVSAAIGPSVDTAIADAANTAVCDDGFARGAPEDAEAEDAATRPETTSSGAADTSAAAALSPPQSSAAGAHHLPDEAHEDPRVVRKYDQALAADSRLADHIFAHTSSPATRSAEEHQRNTGELQDEHLNLLAPGVEALVPALDDEEAPTSVIGAATVSVPEQQAFPLGAGVARAEFITSDPQDIVESKLPDGVDAATSGLVRKKKIKSKSSGSLSSARSSQDSVAPRPKTTPLAGARAGTPSSRSVRDGTAVTSTSTRRSPAPAKGSSPRPSGGSTSSNAMVRSSAASASAEALAKISARRPPVARGSSGFSASSAIKGGPSSSVALGATRSKASPTFSPKPSTSSRISSSPSPPPSPPPTGTRTTGLAGGVPSSAGNKKSSSKLSQARRSASPMPGAAASSSSKKSARKSPPTSSARLRSPGRTREHGGQDDATNGDDN